MKTTDDWELTPAQRKKLDEALRDLNDRTRWLIVSPSFGKGCWMIYNVSSDCTLMHWTRKRRNRPKAELFTTDVTAFKRKEFAQAVLREMKRKRKWCKDYHLLKCWVSADDKKVTKLGRPEP